jgi:hypothetical protein
LTPAAEKALAGIAPLMRELVKNPEATCDYDMMSGALIWSDEFPEFGVLRQVPGWSVIRFVFRFRTTLILGEPKEEFREFWDEGLRLFPGWPGFAPGRRSSELRAVFHEMSGPANADFDEIEREMDPCGGDQDNSG